MPMGGDQCHLQQCFQDLDIHISPTRFLQYQYPPIIYLFFFKSTLFLLKNKFSPILSKNIHEIASLIGNYIFVSSKH